MRKRERSVELERVRESLDKLTLRRLLDETENNSRIPPTPPLLTTYPENPPSPAPAATP